ncbi:hypothetical protein A2572_00965 [Candidatus Collierbacteria bacterium RIFOXYD1_FULL_40_9]|uniref:Uncharacterized protein n=1 Tax=Candidatus Collierbacteria bacterium RIFOXYD1_FULL_40_9 TaxID=1817731 RepID=A0A1F5FW09_9BACT|nr:MAG: hypothetical protein A2572_00965 [Candidatus Collierbacteria bacterium RIFOXYD1_FULL_40_9]
MKNVFRSQVEKWKKADWQDKVYGVLLLVGMINAILLSFIPSLHESYLSIALMLIFVFTIYVGIIDIAGGIIVEAGSFKFALEKSFIQMLGAIFSALFLGAIAWTIGFLLFSVLIWSFIPNLDTLQSLSLGRITSLVITLGGGVLTILVKSWNENKQNKTR